MKLINGTKVFMIRRADGLLSNGGRNPRFRAEGKMWKTLGQVKCHLAMFRTFKGENLVPPDWEIIEVRLVQFGNPQNASAIAQPACNALKERYG